MNGERTKKKKTSRKDGISLWSNGEQFMREMKIYGYVASALALALALDLLTLGCSKVSGLKHKFTSYKYIKKLRIFYSIWPKM